MSMPDELVIYRAEGMISNGPNGAQVNPACPSVVKRLAELNYKSFQHVRRSIMEMFQLNEATHELTLQHIVYVGSSPPGSPYKVLIDIVGQDSWVAFLDVGLRYRYLRLYARWNDKGTSSISTEININNTTVSDKETVIIIDSNYGSWPNCKHEKPCTIETSRDSEDPGRRFYRCPFYKVSVLTKMFIMVV
jgi:hypothetical protein